ncbi:hypothetical protein R1flu_016749 [Riccia fluitans]|uniref:Uncharacterized protein n=1 Tax=Riccia fluitans TaxID=41844 RepID=A0ABD1YN99_9MARC
MLTKDLPSCTGHTRLYCVPIFQLSSVESFEKSIEIWFVLFPVCFLCSIEGAVIRHACTPSGTIICLTLLARYDANRDLVDAIIDKLQRAEATGEGVLEVYLLGSGAWRSVKVNISLLVPLQPNFGVFASVASSSMSGVQP